jgi:hypothetical protein
MNDLKFVNVNYYSFLAPSFFSFIPLFFHPLTSPSQKGNKCTSCNFSAHFTCSTRVGKTCLSPLAHHVWQKRNVIDIVSVSFSKLVENFFQKTKIYHYFVNFFLFPSFFLLQNEIESKVATILFFADSFEVLFESEGKEFGQKLLQHAESIPLNENVIFLPVVSSDVNVRIKGGTEYSFVFERFMFLLNHF